MSYIIEIERDIAKGEGTLKYKNGTIFVNTTCWFELTNRIPERKYIACSATHMATKKNSKGQKREGIYLPDKQTARRGIFIHMGVDSTWSDGCIVIEEKELLKIWDSIQPKNGSNITVVIKNK